MQLETKSQTFPSGPGALLISLISPFFLFPVSPDHSQEHEIFFSWETLIQVLAWSLRSQLCESFEEVKGRRFPVDLMYGLGQVVSLLS